MLNNEDRKKYINIIKKIVIRLHKTAKKDRVEITVIDSVEGQQALRIREIQALEACAAAAKRTADALEAQGDDIRVIKRCLVGANNSHTEDSGKSAEALLAIAVSMQLSCAMSLLTWLECDVQNLLGFFDFPGRAGGWGFGPHRGFGRRREGW